MRKVIKYTLAILLIIIVLIYFIGSRENIDNSTDTSKQDTNSELETEEKGMTKERTFDADCSNEIHEKTERALNNIIRIYDYQKDIPTGKKLAEDMKEYTGDDEQSKKFTFSRAWFMFRIFKKTFL